MTTQPGNTPRALSFDEAAAHYAAVRPDYPPALFDAIEDLTARPLAGSDVLDCGAGTGIATRLLRARGARVVSLEPGAGMAAELRRAEPTAPLVRGDGNHLPFAANTFDLLTYAQAWHWTDPDRSVPEALRVLRPDGALALWWNEADVTVEWVAEEERALSMHARGATDELDGVLAPYPVTLETVRVPWSRRLTVTGHVRNIASHSHFLIMDPADRTKALDGLTAELERLFPDGELDEPYVCNLTVVRPAAG
ncbi:putative methyltransferase [Streptomyces sp. RB5]|uniref:Putative methyltransferase n=1 Tax=Streptomyces smaragdinus TaxID=2585196 RepID=A0A7K0CSR8_9ACTN|nr:class I SAM-dependent methyltransferase [Streptomyces smaragdinus]MQY16509.1 putative methyltransferase [Streptomyces smaragdinus]